MHGDGGGIHKSGSGSSPGTKPGGTLSLDVQPPEAREMKVCCLPPHPTPHPVCGISL